MYKKKIRTYFLPFVIWFVVVSLLRFKLSFGLIFLFLGGLLGTVLFDLDHLLYVLFINSGELTSLRVRKYISEKRIKEAIKLLFDTYNERQSLVFHSVVFQVVLLVLAFFVLTSTNSSLGTGMVMALMLASLVSQARSLLSGNDISSWFWQLKKKPHLKSQKLLFAVMTFIFLGFSYLFILF